MSALDRIRELDKERQKLIEEAKEEALQRAKAAVKDLNDLGYAYELRTTTPTVRRSGVREKVLEAVKQRPEGIGRQELASALGMADSKGKQSLSNAIAALKKAGKITGEDGIYTAT